MFNLRTPLVFLIWVITSSIIFNISASETIYELLRTNGLPMGLLPKGVTNFTYENATGRFEVHLDQACNAKFEDEIHYECNVTGNLTFGQISGLSGISAQDLFLWFPVKEIRVDIPSSGLIYFDVGVVSKQFSLSSFETPRECLAASNLVMVKSVYKTLSRKMGFRKGDHQEQLITLS